MRPALVLALAASAAAAAAACDWREFDDLEKHTPVLNLGAPKSYVDADDFGRVVLPVAPPADVAARYVVSAATKVGLGIIDLDAAGQPSGQSTSPIVINELDAAPVTALAEVPGAQKVLLGAAQPVGGRVYLMTTAVSPPTIAVFAMSGTETRFGLGVAAAELTGNTTPDLVVVSADALHVYADGSTTDASAASSATCPIALSPALEQRYRLNRAVIAAKLGAGGATLVAVGTPAPTGGAGSVSLFAVSAGVVTCALSVTGAEARFGQSLAAGDFDGDGVQDLLVGAPPRDAYVFKGPVGPAGIPVHITYADGGGQFGFAVAAFNTDGKPADRALIADPDAVVAGKQAAGVVVVYAGPMLATKVAVLSANEPGAGANYGTTVAGLPFCKPPCIQTELRRLPLVGANGRTFTHFLIGPTETDPRRR